MPDRQAAAMLECEDGETEANSNCTHCQASGDNQKRYWDIQLDQDLLETICSIYPEWFKDCNMNLGLETSTSTDLKAKQEEINQKTIDKNKESLKVKLMLRRPFNHLVDQGILPSLKSPQSFHDTRQKLERSKMGDILKHKIQKRPDRQELIQQHILEDSCIDSSLQDRQRQLKRARLADGLNEKLALRPGPLELVKVNILHADEILAQAVREGGLPFRTSCDTPSPQLRLGPDDDSGSDGAFSPSPPYDCNEHSQGSLPSLDANESSPNPNQGSPYSVGTFSMSPPSSASSPLSVLPSVVSPQSAQEQMFDYMVHLQHPKDTTPTKNRKKTKPKTQPKARTIKFHEYKGPPNAQKTSSVSSSTPTEPSYDLLLQQQQLQLQWQLEWLQKNPQAVLHTPQKRSGDQITQVSQKAIPSIQTQQQVFDASPASPQKLLSKLEDMKVSDLKTELKKRNLPVSGSKPTLIERLKSYSELPQASTSTASSPGNASSQQLSVNQILDNLSSIPADVASVSGSLSSVEGGLDTIKCLLNAMSPSSRPPSAISLDLEAPSELDMGDVVSDSSSTSFTNEDIVQLQQRFIEKLQRELERSQLQLQQSKQSIISHPSISAITSTPSIGSKSAVHVSFSDNASTTNVISPSVAGSNNSDPSEATQSSESKAIQRQMIHQYLQQKIQHQQLQQRLMQEVQQKQANINARLSDSSSNNSTLTALLERQPINASSIDLDVVTEAVTSFASTVNNRDNNRTNSIEVTEFSVIPIENEADSNRVNDIDNTEYPGVIPIENVNEDDDLEAQFDVVSPLMVNVNGQSDSESNAISAPNVISNRSSSLPSFSALVSCKPAPTRSNTDPQFVITKPPPDYNEATRQLNKVKQQLTSEDGNPRQSKIHKSSLKSQAVDDVLEILIKNGELPPSAAQEPPTPAPHIAKTETSSIPIYTNSNDVFFSKPMTTTTTMAQTPVSKDVISSSPDLHMSLQSVLELTPPSSAGFGDTGSAPTSSLDFDFSLDMSEIDGMDLDNLENPHTTSSSDPSLTTSAAKSVKACMEFLPTNGMISSNHMRTAEMTDISDRRTDRSMDMDLIEWLEVLEEHSATSSASSNFHHTSSYGIANDHDPLFSTNAHDTLDLFASDDIDFKPQHDLNFLPWGDKTDFTV